MDKPITEMTVLDKELWDLQIQLKVAEDQYRASQTMQHEENRLTAAKEYAHEIEILTLKIELLKTKVLINLAQKERPRKFLNW